jgi:hypothetical protein
VRKADITASQNALIFIADNPFASDQIMLKLYVTMSGKIEIIRKFKLSIKLTERV